MKNKKQKETYHPTRRDFFAAHALQGLLASGKFTEQECDYSDRAVGESPVLYQYPEFTADGDETGRKIIYSPAVEMAWQFSDWMIKDENL